MAIMYSRPNRALLESLKFLSVPCLLAASLVCKYWNSVANHREVWLLLLSTTGLPGQSTLSPKACYQTAFQTFLVAFDRFAVHRYYPVTGKWRSTALSAGLDIGQFVLGKPQRCDIRAVLIGRELAFCWGNTAFRVVIVNLLSGICQSKATMVFPRRYPGLCILGNYVYAFCGSYQAKETSICERFALQLERWSSLPQATSPRQSFNPAPHKELIYLAGGGSPFIETFTPQTTSFHVVSVDFTRLDCATTLLVQDCLYVFNDLRCASWSLASSQYTTRSYTVRESCSVVTAPLAWGSCGLFLCTFWRGWKVCKLNFTTLQCEVVGVMVDKALT